MGLFDANTISQLNNANYGNINAQRSIGTAGVDTRADSAGYRDWTQQQGQGTAGNFNQFAQEVTNDAARRGQPYIAQGGQYMAMGGGVQQQAYNDIGNWLQAGPGPSVAQAQLREQNDQNTANAMALANSGRGSAGSAAARNQAMFQNAAMGQQMNQQAATLRAQEAQAWRGQQLQAQGLRSDIGGNISGLGLQQAQLGQNVTGQGQALASNLYQAGAQNQLAWNQLGQQNYQQGAQLRGQMTEAAQNQATQIALANQKDYQSLDASEMGFIGGIMNLGGGLMGGK